MRILHVLDHSLPLHSGYTFRTRAILKAQQAMGWDVACLTGARHKAGHGAGHGTGEADPEIIDGLTFYRTPHPAEGPPAIREWREIRALRKRLDRLVADWRPDQLHVHSPVLNALAALPVARRRAIPLLYEIRAFWEDAAVGNGTGSEGSLRYRLTRMLETRAARQADAVAVICEGLRGSDRARHRRREDHGRSERRRHEPVRQSAAPSRELAKSLGLDEADVVGFIGSFYDYEGIDDLIAAMPSLLVKRPRAHLLLVGGGPMEAQLRAQAERSAAAHRIRFVGRVPHEEVERYYSLIDVLAYPRKAMRLTELVTPLKPLEAMAQMKLVAASDVGGHRELIEDDVTGTLFPPDNPPAIADALDRLFADRDNWGESGGKERGASSRRIVTGRQIFPVTLLFIKG